MTFRHIHVFSSLLQWRGDALHSQWRTPATMAGAATVDVSGPQEPEDPDAIHSVSEMSTVADAAEAPPQTETAEDQQPTSPSGRCTRHFCHVLAHFAYLFSLSIDRNDFKKTKYFTKNTLVYTIVVQTHNLTFFLIFLGPNRAYR